MQHVGLSLLFQQLNTTSEQQLDTAVRVCQKLLNLMPKEIIEQLLSDPSTSALLEIGSKHGYESVRALVLEQLARLNVRLLFSNANYIAIVGRGLMDQNLSVSKLASSIILSWVQSIHETDALRLMFDANSPFLSILQQGMTLGDVIRLRVCELFANISNVSENAFNACVSTSILDQFVQDVVHSEYNVLTLLNLLEIVKKFCSSRYIIEWMHKKGLFSSIIKILIDHEEDELISSFIFHLVADVSATGHQILSDEFFSSNDDIIFQKLYDSMRSQDLSKQKSALVVIGNLCSQSSIALKKFLLNSPERRHKYLSIVVDAMSQDILITFLHSLAQIGESIPNHGLVQPLFDQLETDIIPNRTHKWNNNFLMNQLLEYIRTDVFADIRHAVFHVFRALAYHPWGINNYLLQHPDFLPFLLKRSTEITKEAKDWKYGIAEIIWRTIKNNKSICGDKLRTQDYVNLRVFLQRGPYLEDTEASVLIDTKSA
jgi:hypothetical protein